MTAPRIPPPLPDEDELDQLDRREDQRFLAPLIFGPLVGFAATLLLSISFTAFGLKLNGWLDRAMDVALVIVVGPLAIYRLTRSRPDWVETGLVEEHEDISRPSA